jgi:hypothetical protein
MRLVEAPSDRDDPRGGGRRRRAACGDRLCSLGDVHLNTAGYGVVAQAFAEELAP